MSRLTHGHAKAGAETPEYRVWKSMISRCHNPKRDNFARYGGRGIRVFLAWRKSFAAFFAYVGPRPSLAHTLDRIKNNRGYQPGNVRWATRAEQARNSRRARNVRVDGQLMALRDAAALYGKTFGLVASRLELGWTLKRALTTPPKGGQPRPGRHGKFPCGVEWQDRPGKKPYLARAMIGGVRKRLGNFETAAEAHAAYLRAKRRPT